MDHQRIASLSSLSGTRQARGGLQLASELPATPGSARDTGGLVGASGRAGPLRPPSRRGPPSPSDPGPGSGRRRPGTQDRDCQETESRRLTTGPGRRRAIWNLDHYEFIYEFGST